MLELDKETWEIVRRAAQGGDAEAQFLLGHRLVDTRLDWEDCETWLKAAAEQDHPEAVYHLAHTTFRPEFMTSTIPPTRTSNFVDW